MAAAALSAAPATAAGNPAEMCGGMAVTIVGSRQDDLVGSAFADTLEGNARDNTFAVPGAMTPSGPAAVPTWCSVRWEAT